MKQLFILILSLICLAGQAFAQTPEQLKAALPALEGWNITTDIEVFNSDNLYERINGAAPLFLENNFQEMTSLEYTKGDDYITIQVYRHATPEDAFGMYASERSSEMTHYPAIGGDAQGDGYGLFFFVGDLYVKMMASDETEEQQQALLAIATVLSAAVDAHPGYPAALRSFPTEGRIPYTESYITANYIGHEFLKPAFTADYSLDGRTFQAFVIDGKTTEGAKAILESYFAFTKQTDTVAEGKLLAQDRYNGNIPLIWNGQYIVGAFDENGEDFATSIYDFLAQLQP
jgi:hypothetical protein